MRRLQIISVDRNSGVEKQDAASGDELHPEESSDRTKGVELVTEAIIRSKAGIKASEPNRLVLSYSWDLPELERQNLPRHLLRVCLTMRITWSTLI